MANLKQYFEFFVGVFFISTSECYKIIALFPYASRSHFNVFLPIANELAVRGHDITLVQPYREINVHQNIKVVRIPFIEESKSEMSQSLFTEKKNYIDIPLLDFKDWAEDMCKYTVTSTEFHALLNKGKQYDIAIVNVIFNECGLSVSSLLASHVILFSAGPLPSYIRNPAPKLYSEIPNYFLPLPSKMNFFQKIENSFVNLRDFYAYNYVLIPSFQEIVYQHISEAIPISESWNKIVLTVQNSAPVIVQPRPTVPNVIEVICPHCRKAKPLPKDLQAFIDGSNHDGFIIFGLGSLVQSIHLPKNVIKGFLNAFTRLKQRVIWKFEDDSLQVPSNVKIIKWMPQQDLLGSSKIRLFITHGGLLSLQEAVYHGVPVIGIPMFGDQVGNLVRMEELGLGGRLDLNNITAEGIYEAISKILNDKSYKDRMEKASKILNDKDSDGVSKGVYWIEYVARHNGANHLRTIGEDMSWVEYFLLDVITFILIILLVTLYIFKVIIKMIWNQFSTVKRKTD